MIEGLVRVLPFSHGNLWAQSAGNGCLVSVSVPRPFSECDCTIGAWKALEYLELWARR